VTVELLVRRSFKYDQQTHDKRVNPGDFDLIERKGGQRIEHTIATLKTTGLYIRYYCQASLLEILHF